jgi:hypothetical protein
VEASLHSPDSNANDRTTSSLADPRAATAEGFLSSVGPIAGEEEPVDAQGNLRVALGQALKGKEKGTGRSTSMARFTRGALKGTATAFIVALAGLASLIIWESYVAAPWTRDGSIRVQVASIAPLVSGQITEIRVVDNEFVRQGDVLYVIDPFDFKVALETSQAQLRQKGADLQVKRI